MGRQENDIAHRKPQSPPARNGRPFLHQCRESHSERLGATLVASVPPDALHYRSAPMRWNTNPSEGSSRTMRMLLHRSSAAPRYSAGLVVCHWPPCTCANVLGSYDNRKLRAPYGSARLRLQVTRSPSSPCSATILFVSSTAAWVASCSRVARVYRLLAWGGIVSTPCVAPDKKSPA